MKIFKAIIFIVVLVTFIIHYPSYSQISNDFLPACDTCQMLNSSLPVQQSITKTEANTPIVRIAYLIPSNRNAQPNGVKSLQNAMRIGQEWLKGQMEQNSFGAKTFLYETEADGITPLIHIVQLDETDDYLREDLWSHTILAASQAGISVWSPGEVWILIPESHLMLPDGTIEGSVALGASNATGDSPGVVVLGSNGLAVLEDGFITNNTPYDGKVLETLGPYPMVENVTYLPMEKNTFSSISSSYLGALFHELGHAFGLPHDYRNDENFHGNLIYNGLRGIRGSLYPELYPQDYTRLSYSSALILNTSHYFNRNKKVTSLPHVSISSTGSVQPEQGLVHIDFSASDEDSLSFAHLRYEGDVVEEILLDGKETEAGFTTPFYNVGADNQYIVSVFDKQGNIRSQTVKLYVQGGSNHAPIPFIRIEPPIPGPNQSITLDASRSSDKDHQSSTLLAEWDVDNDGKFDTAPSTDHTISYKYAAPGNYLVRLRVTDPEGAQTISTPVSVHIPGEAIDVKVTSFTLIDVADNEEVAEIQNNDVINLYDFKDKIFSIRANTDPEVVDSVRFELNGPFTYQRIERKPPYALFSDEQGDYLGKALLPGEYTLTAIPYAQNTIGTTLTVSFKIIEDLVADTPPDIEWDKTFGGNDEDFFSNIIPTSDGTYFLAGFSWSSTNGDKSETKGGSDYWLVNMDKQANKIWDKAYGSIGFDVMNDAISTPDGNYLLGGYSDGPASADKSENGKGQEDFWIIKVDDQGNKIWDKTFGGSGGDNLFSIISTADGGYLLGGHSTSSISGDKSEDNRGGRDFWIVKIDAQGNKVWDKTFGGSGDDRLSKMISVSGDSYLLGGLSESPSSGDKSEDSKGFNDFWIVKVDAQGNKIWDKTLGGNGNDELRKMISTPDGGYLLTGSSSSDASGDKSEDRNSAISYAPDFWLVKVDAQGNIIWDKTIGGNGSDGLQAALDLNDGTYLLGGTSNSDASVDKSEDSKGFNDFWLVKIDAKGNKIWDKTIGGESYDYLRDLVTTDDGGYLLAGESESGISGDKSENNRGASDYWIVKTGLKDTPMASVSSFTLINTQTDQDILELQEGDVINLAELESQLISIRANTLPEMVDSVKFELQGPLTYRRIERKPPYALFSDSNGDYIGRKLRPGKYTIIATPYYENQAGTALTLSFELLNTFEINPFTLIDAKTDQVLYTLKDGAVIDLAPFNHHQLTIRAEASPKVIDKVVFKLEGPTSHSSTIWQYPYSLYDIKPGNRDEPDYRGMQLKTGNYTLKATPYLMGCVGPPYTIAFKVINSKFSSYENAPIISVYPVPTTGILNVTVEGATAQSELMLMDCRGDLLVQQTIDKQFVKQLDLSAFKKGVYYLKVITPLSVQVKRIVLNK